LFRSPIILLAVPAGLAAGALAWFAAGGASASATRLDPLRSAISIVRRSHAQAVNSPLVDIGDLSSLPLLLLTTGPGAVPEPAVRLDGLVRTRARKAALLSVNDGPAEWLALGETRDGVSLQDVLGNHVQVETPYGLQIVAVGERSGPSGSGAPPAAATPAAAPPPPDPHAATDKVPPGFHAPPPPASAPRPR
jgi:hypothetical protein